jgi:hypothetical protein
MYNKHMTFAELLQKERAIWGNDKQALEHIVICMGKNYGDLSKQARSKIENGQLDEIELKKELGNMIASTIRWIDDLGFSVDECIELALKSQKAYKGRQ